jgi:hypothetical protein
MEFGSDWLTIHRCGVAWPPQSWPHRPPPLRLLRRPNGGTHTTVLLLVGPLCFARCRSPPSVVFASSSLRQGKPIVKELEWGYRWPDGPGTMGRPENGPKKHGPRTVRHGSDRASGWPGTMPVVFIHCPYSNPHPPQMGRVWIENNYPLKKWGG